MIKPSSLLQNVLNLIKMSANENYQDEPQEKEFKRTVKFIKEFNEFKEDTKKNLSKIKEKEFTTE